MNKEIIKAMNRKEKKHTIRKWWNKNDYKVIRVIFFPIWIGSIIKEKIEVYLNSRNKWDEERANEILQYYIPRRAEWLEDEKAFYFFDNGYGWGMTKNFLKDATADFGNFTRIFAVVRFVIILFIILNLKVSQKK